MPIISIIVPVYNGEKYIGRCIESIQGQTLTDWELILVDDCSQDNSLCVIQDYANKDKRIRVKHQEANLGPMVARHTGDQMATGQYITYCDSDDTFPPSALKKLYDVAISSDADIVLGNYCRIYANGKHKEIKNKLRYGNDAHGVLKSLLYRECKHALWSKLFKAKLLKNFEYSIVEKMTNSEDSYFFYQVLMNATTIVNIPDIVYNYYVIPNSSTQKKLSKNAINNIFVMDAYRISLIKKFPDLKKKIARFVAWRYVVLKIKGYNKKGLLDKLALHYGIKEYCSLNKYVRIDFPHSICDLAKLFFKEYMK